MSMRLRKKVTGLEDKYKIRNFKVLNLTIQYLTVLVKSVQNYSRAKKHKSKFSPIENILINLHQLSRASRMMKKKELE
jgi:hypothetical protein